MDTRTKRYMILLLAGEIVNNNKNIQMVCLPHGLSFWRGPTWSFWSRIAKTDAIHLSGKETENPNVLRTADTKENWERNDSSSSSGLKDVHFLYMNTDLYRFILIYCVRYCDSLSDKLCDWVECEGKARCVGGQGQKTCICGRSADNKCSRKEVCAIFLCFQDFFTRP